MNLLKRLSIFIPILFLVIALLTIWHELSHLKYGEIRAALHQLPASHVFLAVVLTFCNYIVLIAYDYLAIKSIGRPVPLRAIAMASFIGFTTSYNFSSLLGGPAIRFRFYSQWGFTPKELLQVLVMVGATFWIGAIALASVLFVFLDVPVPARLNLPIHSTRWLGVALACITATYLAFVMLSRSNFKIRDTSIPIPSLRVTALQIATAAVDLAIAAASLYVLIGEDMQVRYEQFLAIYLLATLAVVVTNVPGGVGVFELVFISFTPVDATSHLIAALLLFRIIYYLLPLLLAMVLLGAHEMVPYRSQVKSTVKMSNQWWQAVAPYVFSLGTFLSGSVLLLSGATPGIVDRMRFATRFMPDSLLEISHFLGSIVGACLLLLARGLYRRLDSAYWFTCGLLIAGILLSLLKGLDFEEAILLACILAGLIPAKRAFYRHGRLTAQPLSTTWLVAIALVMVCALWLGMFSMRHSEYQDRDWWGIVFSTDAPRTIRATVAAVSALTLFGVLRLLAPHPPKQQTASKVEMEQAFAIANNSPRTYSHLAMLGDKQLLFNAEKTAYVMYARQGRSWVAMSDPVGPIESIAEMVWTFREMVDRFGGWSVFYQVDPSNLTVYLDHGMTLLKIGEEARVPLKEFSLTGSSRKGLRQTVNRMDREKVSFEILAIDQIPAALPRLKEISDAWMENKGIPEKGFSLGFFDEEYLKHYPCAVAKKEGSIVAFANVLTNECKEELSIDLMRYDPDAASGVMEFLFIHLFLWGQANGYAWFNLGMAPLSGIESRKLSPIWNRMTNLLFKHGERLYHFEGLRQYKEKFDPIWTSRYIALSGGVAQWKAIADVAQLISRKRD